MGRGVGDGGAGGARHVLAGTFVPEAFISFGLFNIFPYFPSPYQVVNTYPLSIIGKEVGNGSGYYVISSKVVYALWCVLEVDACVDG
jgi:hypothetical protein